MAVFTLFGWISLGTAFLCALVIAIDEIRHPRKMWIMNIVWPSTALYLSVFALWGYLNIGRGMTKNAMHGMSLDRMRQYKKIQEGKASRNPTWRQTAEYVGDLLLAWLFGVAFQYLVITPMRKLSPKQALIAAVKSDTLAILTLKSVCSPGWP